MKKYKVCVYAICKNEEKFVNRWVDSMNEADEIYVLDTGSTDKTVELLQKRNVFVTTKVINPWRFDKARNESLSLVPFDADICVCTDLDEVFDKGWRTKLEKLWNKDLNKLRYNYIWSFTSQNKPSVNFYQEKIHSRNDYIWTHPVHEVLTFTKEEEKTIITDEITLKHYPDQNKSRSNYLPLLELSVKENPNDDRNMHYLGREYMYYRKWNKSIDTLIKHLKLPNAVWKDERSASMRFISRCYKNLKRYDEAQMWLEKAINETPYLRDPYIEMALLKYDALDYKSVIEYTKQALKITSHQKTYINEPFSWNETPYDLLSLAYFYLNDYKKSYKNILKALKINPDDERLKDNKILIKKALEKQDN